MSEFMQVLNETCTGCQTNDRNLFVHNLCLLTSV